MHTGTGLASDFESGLGDRKRRQLAMAVLASLVLHALVLTLLSSFEEYARSRAAPPPLTARLAKPKPPPSPPEKVEPLPPVPSPRTAALPKAAPRAPEPVLAPAAPSLSMEPAKKTEEPALVVPVVPAQPALRIEPRSEPRSEPVAASGPDPASVARYRMELMDIARRYKRYPRIAQDNNWEGRVELRVGFSESGAMTLLSVKKGAGRAVLDEEAQAMIRSAQAQATIPPALRGKAFTIEIPVDFFLKEAR